MSFLKPDPPEPPNPIVQAAAQTGSNVSTAVANAMLNRVSQSTPQGDLTYNTTGSYAWTDPSTGTTYSIPLQTATQTLSATQQAIQGQQEAAQYNLAGMANSQSSRISQLLSNELDLSGAPAAGDASDITGIQRARTSFEGGGDIARGFGEAGDITRSYGPQDNFSADRMRVEEALYGRLNPQLQRERSNVEQRLQDQGIRYGSAAYTSAMDDYNRQANDLRLGVTAQGGTEQQRLNQMAAQQAAFQNAAQGQAYEQAQGRGQFANQAQAQQFGQNALQAQFENAGLAQQLQQAQAGFNAEQIGRNQWLQEQYQARNQPINEIMAMLSGSQVSQPNWINATGSQIANTDVAGLQQQSFANQMQNYTQQSNAVNNLLGNLIGAAGKAYASDERVKKDIDRIGTVFAYDENKGRPRMSEVIGERKELPIYEYAYKDDPSETRHTGPMAQDVEKIDKKAVKTIKGVKHILPERVMGNILRAA